MKRNSLHRPYFAHEISTGNNTHASRAHSMNNFYERGCVIERGAYLEFLIANGGLSVYRT